MRSWWFPTNKSYSMGIIQDYDGEKLCFSEGCITTADGKWALAKLDAEPNRAEMQKNIDALKEEKKEAAKFINPEI
jgi:hypothetical protein